jgi:hypothetical protein
MDKTVKDLRNELFDTLEKLKNGALELDKAKAITNVAQTIINSAKVEVDFIKAVGGIATGSGFIPLEAKRLNTKSTEQKEDGKG